MKNRVLCVRFHLLTVNPGVPAEPRRIIRIATQAAGRHILAPQDDLHIEIEIGPRVCSDELTDRGQPITHDDTRVKIELLQRVARDVWG